MDLCTTCGEEFVKVGKTYSRYSLEKVTTPYTARKTFPGIKTPLLKGKICRECMVVLREQTFIHKPSRKRKWKWIRTPSKYTGSPSKFVGSPCPKRSDNKATPQKKEYSFSKIDPDKSFRDRAVTYLMNSKYEACLRTLITNSEAARTALITVMSSEIHKEMSRVTKKKADKMPLLMQTFKVEETSTFAWKQVVDEAKENLPVFHACLDAGMPTIKTLRNQVQKGRTGARR